MRTRTRMRMRTRMRTRARERASANASENESENDNEREDENKNEIVSSSSSKSKVKKPSTLRERSPKQPRSPPHPAPVKEEEDAPQAATSSPQGSESSGETVIDIEESRRLARVFSAMVEASHRDYTASELMESLKGCIEISKKTEGWKTKEPLPPQKPRSPSPLPPPPRKNHGRDDSRERGRRPYCSRSPFQAKKQVSIPTGTRALRTEA